MASSSPSHSGLGSDEGKSSSSHPLSGSDEGKLLAALAHEINNPLDALLNFLYLIEAEAGLSDRARDYLRLAREEVHRISKITHSAMRPVRDQENLEHISVPELLRSVLEFYKSRFENRGIAVNAHYYPVHSVAVYSGPLRQVFSNLVLNAADAMPGGGTMEVKVSAAREWTGQQRHGVRVTFADNGCGIPVADIPRVLEPFFTTKGHAGNGLGLSMVNDTVHRHGGALRFRTSTRPGHSGSVFSIFLPVN